MKLYSLITREAKYQPLNDRVSHDVVLIFAETEERAFEILLEERKHFSDAKKECWEVDEVYEIEEGFVESFCR